MKSETIENKELAAAIDHTLLRADATAEQITVLCSEAKRHGFASVCVNPGWVRLCADNLRGSGVKVCAVIGFPLGSTSTESKAAEASVAIKDGAEELDMVINIGRLLGDDRQFVRDDIKAVTEAAGGMPVKAIIEICYLSDEKIITACRLALEAGAAFVKTSTGFGSGGATEHAVRLMRRTVGPDIGIKASGGIKTKADALKMLNAGASRIGTSAGVAIIGGT
ncbi:MAG: deoxyribose-phosphate aldolase [Thermoplasmata archaeon]|nr:deoxyribose-phosphate aldolase [Thermoplasmata archaeon]